MIIFANIYTYFRNLLFGAHEAKDGLRCCKTILFGLKYTVKHIKNTSRNVQTKIFNDFKAARHIWDVRTLQRKEGMIEIKTKF